MPGQRQVPGTQHRPSPEVPGPHHLGRHCGLPGSPAAESWSQLLGSGTLIQLGSPLMTRPNATTKFIFFLLVWEVIGMLVTCLYFASF